jgi:hypothetical protein
MDTITKVINYIADYINAVPASSWYTLGALLGSSTIVIAVVAWIKRRHLSKYAEEMSRAIVTANVIFWSMLTTTLSFILTNGPSFAPFLPFLGTHLPQIIAISTVIYNVAKPSLAWWKARKDGEPIQPTEDLTPLVQQIQQPVPPKSFGTESAGVQISDII